MATPSFPPRGSLCWTFWGEGLGAAGNLAVSCSNAAGAEPLGRQSQR